MNFIKQYLIREIEKSYEKGLRVAENYAAQLAVLNRENEYDHRKKKTIIILD